MCWRMNKASAAEKRSKEIAHQSGNKTTDCEQASRGLQRHARTENVSGRFRPIQREGSLHLATLEVHGDSHLQFRLPARYSCNPLCAFLKCTYLEAENTTLLCVRHGAKHSYTQARFLLSFPLVFCFFVFFFTFYFEIIVNTQKLKN